jgi:lysophospholipase L1-like esterase
MHEMHIAVFGTSLMWGQGLNEEDKIHAVLVRLLQGHHADVRATTYFLAHSGASTGYNADGSIDTHQELRIHGEVPTSYPTILQQIDEFDAHGVSPDAIELVVLDAGINDVDLTVILDPLTTPQQIEALVESYCYQHMLWLIEKLTAKFKNARIVIAAYYEFLTEESQRGYIRTLLRALGNVPGGFIADGLLRLVMGRMKKRLLENCDTFSDESLIAFQRVADEINGRSKSKRVLVARPNIGTQNAAFASDPWVFGVRSDLSPQDPQAEVRAAACQQTDITRKRPFICSRASVGHPNPKGAKAYAEAVFAVLQPDQQ